MNWQERNEINRIKSSLECKKKVEELGGVLNSPYINNSTPLDITCKNRHKSNPTWQNVRKRNGICKICASRDAETAKLKFNEFITHRGEFIIGKFINTQTPVEIRCNKGHEYKSYPCNITTHNKGCPYCVNKTEGKFLDFLNTTNYKIVRQFRPEWCKTKRGARLRYDFCLPELNILIEIDGRQHYEQVANWTPFEKINKRDKFKIRKAIQNGYTIIHMCQEEIWKDKIDWKMLLQNELYRSIEYPTLKFIGNNEYLFNLLK